MSSRTLGYANFKNIEQCNRCHGWATTWEGQNPSVKEAFFLPLSYFMSYELSLSNKKQQCIIGMPSSSQTLSQVFSMISCLILTTTYEAHMTCVLQRQTLNTLRHLPQVKLISKQQSHKLMPCLWTTEPLQEIMIRINW